MKRLIFIFYYSLILAAAISFSGCKDSVVNPPDLKMISPWSITYDNEYLWVSDDSLSAIFKINSENKVVSAYHLPNKKIRGITSDGAYLWVLTKKFVIADKSKFSIYRVNKSNGSISDSIIINLSTSIEANLFDVCYYNSKLYVSFYGGWGACIFEINPISRELERELCCAHPCGLAIINEELWCIRMNREDGCGNYMVKLSFTTDLVEENIETKKSFEYFVSDFVYKDNQLVLIDRDSNLLKTVPF
ncbi:MAG: hypothetical protein KJ799_04940 [Bacteroidetes bacterium]|nr:hypothetical protein [Bacteroidota bacterium]MBU1677942.1 hypothetical protein [Bacteroidota bacterium]MBU2506053.1 hypothetical protein [Bacteroidota bacterium]